MDELYENRYTVTKKIYMDWAKNSGRKNYFVIIWIIIMTFTFYMFIGSLVYQEIMTALFYLLLTAFSIYSGFFRKYFLISKHFKTLSVSHGADAWERTIRLADDIEIIDGNTTIRYQWKQVITLVDRKNYAVLILDNKLGIRLNKDGFTVGDFDSFLIFYNQKQEIIHDKD